MTRGLESGGLCSDSTNDLPSENQAVANSSVVRLDQCSNSASGHLSSILLLKKDGQSPL